MVTINNNKAVVQTISTDTEPKEIKEYVIYKDYWVFKISTSTPELYSDLDQIAQSFKYTPN